MTTFILKNRFNNWLQKKLQEQILTSSFPADAEKIEFVRDQETGKAQFVSSI